MKQSIKYGEECLSFRQNGLSDLQSSNSKVILVVDDSIVLRSILRTALTEEKFIVHSVCNAAEAIICIENIPNIDLIITDFHMPGLNGAALIEKIRTHSHYNAVPILVLTAGADNMEKHHARKAGASGWIIKPFDTAKLAAAINALAPEHYRPSKSAAFEKNSCNNTKNDPKNHGRGSMLKVRYDQTNGLIHTVVEGPTDRDGIEKYLYLLHSLMESSRTEWGRFWHLVDASALELQNAEALSSMSGASIENLAPNDRTALVLTSERAIEQIRTLPSQMMSRIFPDMGSAKEWLLSGAA